MNETGSLYASDKKTTFFAALIIGGTGLVFFVLGILFIISNNSFMKKALTTQAIIDEIEVVYHTGDDPTHNVFVSYTIDGNEYEHVRLSEYSSNMYEGMLLTLYYDPEDISDIRTGEVMNFLGIIFAAIGGTLITFTAIIIHLAEIRRKTAARENGSPEIM